MAIARARLVDLSIARWYHCITRCVRRASLLGEGEGKFDRRDWIEQRLAELGDLFAIAVGGFAIMNNHLHVLLRIDPERAAAWSDEEVVQRWAKLFPPRDLKRKPLPATKAWIEERLQDSEWVARARQRLQSLSWFMKCLKEPLARMANREDKVRGAFFEERFKSIAIADEQALLAVCVYIDLNPVAAGIAPAPEKSDHTSVKQRIEHVEAQGRTAEQVAAPELSVEASAASGGLEESLWLCPIEDRRGLDSLREGMFVGFPLKSYLLLVDYTGRIFREGKARISADLAGIFERLGCPADRWGARLEKLRGGRWFGRVFASTAAKLDELAAELHVRRLYNLCGSPT
jgi:hypothetical protein